MENARHEPAAAAAGATAGAATVRNLDDTFRDFVRNRDTPCPVCSYITRGLTEPRCPECGLALTLRLVSPQARLGWLLVLLAAPLGVAALGLCIATLLLLSPFPGATRGMLLLIGSAPVCGMIAAELYRRRERYLLLPRRLQGLLAALAWLACLAWYHLCRG